MTDLEDGFYWVRVEGMWTVAALDCGQFAYFVLDEPYYLDKSDARLFDEIDPRRIVREGGE